MPVERVAKRLPSSRIAALARRLLDASTLCAIATVSPGGRAHINTAYFAWGPEFEIVWWSAPQAQHSRNVHANASVAIAVFRSTRTWGGLDRGIQLFGRARELRGRASHVAGARVHWLCGVFKEPGLETTPFGDLNIMESGWEDDLGHPRDADELVHALESSWSIVAHCLETWTVDSLEQEARRVRGDEVQMHTRQSVLLRLLTHDAYHTGEMSLVLGSHGLGEIDLWRGLARVLS